MSNGFQRVLDDIRSIAGTEAEKGRLFERLMKALLDWPPPRAWRFRPVEAWTGTMNPIGPASWVSWGVQCLLDRPPRTEGIGQNLQILVKPSRRTAGQSRRWNGT